MIQETERNYLGGLFLMAIREMNPSDISQSAYGLSPDDFYDHQNRSIFQSIKKRLEQGKSFDAMLIIEDCGTSVDARYVLELVRNTASAANTSEYKSLIRQASIKRQGMGVGQKIIELMSQTESPLKSLGMAETMIQSLMGKANSDGGNFLHISDILAQYLSEIENRLQNPEQTTGLMTGIEEFDCRLEDGLQPGSLIVMGGRPGMGKTAMMLALIKGMASQMKDRSALAFSLEMSVQQLAKRYATFYTGRSYDGMLEEMKRDPDGHMWPKLAEMISDNKSLPIYMRGTSSLTIEQLCADVRHHARDNQIGLITVDYLGLMEMPSADRHDLSIGKVTRSLKNLAMETGCVIILLAQLNRGVEQRKDKRPLPSDFRDSGSIEQDADYIITLYRDSVYDEETVMRTIGEAHWCKVRHGAPFRAFMDFRNGNWVKLDMDQGVAHNMMLESLAKSESKPFAKQKSYDV